MPENYIKVGQVGVANFGARRRELLKEAGCFEIVAAYDLNEEALKQACREDGASPCDSYAALLAREDVEAIVLSTGASFHAAQIEMALEAGKHVFVEKPIVAATEEIGKLVEMANKYSHLVIACGHAALDAKADSLEIRKRIVSGELGEIVGFESNGSHSGGFTIQEGDWRGDRDANPGGMLFQCGVHKIHYFRFLFGEVDSVFARFRYDLHSTQTADAAFTMLTMENGIVGTLNAHHVTPYQNYLYIYGTRANLYFTQRFFYEGDSLSIQRLSKTVGGHEPIESIQFSEPTDPCANLMSFYRAIREGKPCYPSWRDGVMAMDTIFAAARSAKSGQPEPVLSLERFLDT